MADGLELLKLATMLKLTAKTKAARPDQLVAVMNDVAGRLADLATKDAPGASEERPADRTDDADPDHLIPEADDDA